MDLRSPRLLHAAYGALALTDTVLAAGPARWHRARLLTKPLLMPLLSAGGVDDPALRAAHALSWAGDVALMSHDRRSFLTGVGAFFGAHLAYISAYGGRSSAPLLATPGRRALLASCATSAAAMGLAAGRKDRSLAVPVAAYGIALGTMVTAAAAVDEDRGRGRILAGAAVFLLSDTLLGVRRFLTKGEDNALEGAVMATYTTAQWLISDGFKRG